MNSGKLKLFEYAVLVHPTEEEAKKGETTVLHKELGTVLGESEQTVVFSVLRKLPESLDVKIAKGLVEVAVRPF